MDAATVIPLSDSAVFGWGALGAFASFLVVFVLPEATKIVKGQQSLAITVPGLLAALVIALVFVFVGGLLAMVYGDAEQTKQAVAYGLGIEGIMGGSLKAFIP